MEYIAYIIIGIGVGLSATSILTRDSNRVQHAQDDLAAKKEWIRMISSRKKTGAHNARRN